MTNPFETPEVEKAPLKTAERREGVTRGGPQVPRDQIWTLVLMKMTGFMLFFYAGGGLVVLLSLIIEEKLPGQYYSFLIFPVIVFCFGVLFTRCSKFSIIMSFILFMLDLVVIGLIYIDYISSDLYKHKNAVFPFIPIAIYGGMALFHFLAAYFLSKNWKLLRTV